jgi:hypothetical protein
MTAYWLLEPENDEAVVHSRESKREHEKTEIPVILSLEPGIRISERELEHGKTHGGITTQFILQ